MNRGAATTGHHYKGDGHNLGVAQL